MVEEAENIIEQMKSKREEQLKKKIKTQRVYLIVIAITIIAFFLVPIIIWKVEYNYTGLISLYIIIPLSILPFLRVQLKNIDDELRNIDFEIDLQKFDVSKKEVRAEKILLINNYQLRRYYDLNLSQNVWVFGLGVFCIILGIAVIAYTIYLELKVVNELDTKIIVGVVGAAGSFMTNYIAAIYLKMHATATSNLVSFHSRLVETHQFLFGNLLASRIEDDKIRWDTLSQIALNISKQKIANVEQNL